LWQELRLSWRTHNGATLEEASRDAPETIELSVEVYQEERPVPLLDSITVIRLERSSSSINGHEPAPGGDGAQVLSALQCDSLSRARRAATIFCRTGIPGHRQRVAQR
jgi:hypothetical protein